MNRPMNPEVLASFLKQNIQPVEDEIYGNRYRASAQLTDGTYLPCVVFQSRTKQVQLALRRFKELGMKSKQFEDVLRTFVSRGSRLSEWQIASVKESPWAWPPALLKTIHGETAMSWTSFVAEMKDGTMHSFGSTFSFEFFELPDGYSHQDISRILSGTVYSAKKGLTPYTIENLNGAIVYRERPYFTCYLDQLG